MINPWLAKHIAEHLPSKAAGTNDVRPLPSHPLITASEWTAARERIKTDLDTHAMSILSHPINRMGRVDLSPDKKTILNVLHGLPLRENWLTLEEAVLYHTLLSISDPPPETNPNSNKASPVHLLSAAHTPPQTMRIPNEAAQHTEKP